MTVYATAQDWARFLQPVAASVRNTPSSDDFRGRCGALAFALRIPAEALTDARARDLCRSAQFWPSVEEVEKLFAEVWKEEARTRALANAGGHPLLPAPPVKRLVPTEAEREAVRLAAEKFRAEVMAKAAVKGRETRTACPLKPHDLLAAYEAQAAQGNRAAAVRAAQIREAMSA